MGGSPKVVERKSPGCEQELASSNEEVIEILRRQIALEEQVITRLDDLTNAATNSAIRHVLHALKDDSHKHRDLCQAAIDVISGNIIREPEKASIKHALQEHTALVRECLTNIKQAIDRVDDPQVATLLQLIATEEDRHQRSLEIITDRDTYDLVSLLIGR
jgi:rubrerythrin